MHLIYIFPLYVVSVAFRFDSLPTTTKKCAWFYALNTVEGLHDDRDLVDVYHAVVVHVVQLERPVQLLSV